MWADVRDHEFTDEYTAAWQSFVTAKTADEFGDREYQKENKLPVKKVEKPVVKKDEPKKKK